MGILSEIEHVRGDTFIISILGILLLFSPGVLTIFFFQRDLFISLDFLKLIFLSVSYIAPFFTINLFLNFAAMKAESRGRNKEIEESNQFWFIGSMMSLLCTGAVFYFALGWSLILKLDLNHMLIKLSLVELLIAAGLIVIWAQYKYTKIRIF